MTSDSNMSSLLPEKFSLDEESTKLILTVALTCLVAVNVVFLFRRRGHKAFGCPYLSNPPEGNTYPFLGNAVNFIRYRPWDLIMGWHQKYGPIVAFPLLGHTMFSIASPELCKLVLQSKISSVKKDIANTMKHFLVILGTGIVSSEGDSWMKQRLKMSTPLRHDVLRMEMIPTQTILAVQRLFEKIDTASEHGDTIPIGQSLRHLTLQVISGTFLSLPPEESDSNFAKLYLPIVDESNTRVWHPYRAYMFFMPFWWKYIYNVYRLNQYVSALIKDRWALRHEEDGTESSRNRDVLDRVLDVYEKEAGKPSSLPNEVVRQLRDEMKTFMLAGHETSAAMMTWTIYELMGDSKLMQQVVDEADSVFGNIKDWKQASASDLPSMEELSKLVLSDACLREALRKYSVVPMVARRAIQDLMLQDKYFIPKDSSVMVNVQAIHHNPEYWPEPMKYDPTRFIGKTPEPFTFLAFIAGPRNCLGQYLALLESKMVISLLTQRYRFSLPEGEAVYVEDWGKNKDPRHRFMVPVVPQNELNVYVERRQSLMPN